MPRKRGFLLKHRVNLLFRRFFRRRRSAASYRCLDPSLPDRFRSVSRLAAWTRRLRAKAGAILQTGRGYIRVGQEPVSSPGPVPKGHMAVYVGQKDGDFERVLVPVVYCNHPLFEDLLRESEKEYGFNHPGGITIPCRISDFERVKTRIKEVQCARKLLTWSWRK
ncbi:SAUR-like auxin-responsive protein family [Striga hermonthica]|uniref:SAUR-like auxin-responsive protein family n=1 Tax=Striga hermonthica TaxID=68872 RepID=A0A9N7P0A4_STRHE|nr:SAUR-like auxin-responsive protein family [Striga hermonthica]